ncbi:hypothetical protein N9344_00445 [bacterium]|nr:hypothetical protein [bacterium]
MKNIVFVIGVLLLVSCCNKKQAVTNSNEEVEVNTANNRIIGTIRVSDDACKVYIDAQMSEDKNDIKKMYPVNIDEKFYKEGMFVRFSYALSRAKQPEGCNVDFVVSVSDLTPLRGR